MKISGTSGFISGGLLPDLVKVIGIINGFSSGSFE